MGSVLRTLLEVAYSGAKVFARFQRFDGTRVTLASLVGDLVAPPLKLDTRPLEGEEDDHAGNGDAARPCGREDEVVLHFLS